MGTLPSSVFRVGSAPDSWGVWFPEDPGQTPWSRFLDEIARAGYEWLELGPYRGLHDGRQVDTAELDDDGWHALVRGAEHLARVLRDETGLRFVFHPHVESHVETDEQIERFLADTDPELVGLCLDTGHVAYTHGDARALLRAHPDRIWYVHVKAVDPLVLEQVEAERMSFADAVRRDVMCEPGLGVPSLEHIRDGLAALPADTFVIVEHDLYPCDFDRPYPIAARTRETLRAAGVG
jgi:inosose dehydratase